MSTENLGLTYLTTNILDPTLPININLMILDALVPHVVMDKDLNTPPTTSGDPAIDGGKVWIIGGSPTGRWAALAQPNDLAVWRGANSEHYITPREGWIFYVRDEEAEYLFDGYGWVLFSGGGTSSAAPVVTDATTNLDADGTNSGNYTRFTNSGTKTYTFDSADTFTVGAEYHGRNVGAGNLTITEAGSFTINPPAGGSLVVPQGGTFTIKIVASAEADLFGLVDP